MLNVVCWKSCVKCRMLIDDDFRLLNVLCRCRMDNVNVVCWYRTSNVQCRALNIFCWTSNVECRMSKAVCWTMYVQCHMLNVVCTMSYVECGMHNVVCWMTNVNVVCWYRMSNIVCQNVKCCKSYVKCPLSYVVCWMSNVEGLMSNVVRATLNIECRYFCMLNVECCVSNAALSSHS